MLDTKKLFTELQALPYFRNYQAQSGFAHNIASHEDAVEDVLKRYHLEPVNFETLCAPHGMTRRQFRDALLAGERFSNFPFSAYCAQPLGNNDSPDFIIFTNGEVYFIECKSAKQNHPMYNGGLPKENYIYLFCSEKSDETTMYMGSDVLHENVREVTDEYTTKIKALEQELNGILSAMPENTRGFSYYARHMYTQQGGKHFTDYFNHNERAECENKVFEHVESNKSL